MKLTIYGWALFLIVSVAIIGIIYAFFAKSDKAEIKTVLVSIPICAVLLFGFNWYYTSTESGARAVKTQESNFNNGITREVKVYDATGNMIQNYSGKFDIEYDDDRILFDDENGLRHIIYYPTGTVIIDEIEE